MTATGLFCGSCGAQSSPTAKFCGECGTRLTQATRSAEYKQVTVLFADVVHSMDIARVLGPERLREIMTELVERSAVVVQRYGGIVDKFTGDGIMVLFGAPVALEDHAFRACLAALDIQAEVSRLAVDVKRADGVDLQLRIGLNSGQVIAGEIGSTTASYTAIGEQVGMAQRMESVAPPGGIMLSESTARLVEDATTLGEAELVQIKGADAPVVARRLVGIEPRRGLDRHQSSLVGRGREMNTIADILDHAIEGSGGVVGVCGPPGIGKSRIVAESAQLAIGRGMDVVTTYCESHTTDIPFHALARLLRAVFGVDGLDAQGARDRVRARLPGADTADLLLLDDLLGIRDQTSLCPPSIPTRGGAG